VEALLIMVEAIFQTRQMFVKVFSPSFPNFSVVPYPEKSLSHSGNEGPGLRRNHENEAAWPPPPRRCTEEPRRPLTQK